MDFRIKVGFSHHPKVSRLYAELGADAVLGLIGLWEFCATSRPDGDLSGMSDLDIALASNYRPAYGPDGASHAVAYATHMRRIGLLAGASKKFRIHDWAEHNPYAATAPKRRQSSRIAALIRWHKNGRHSAPVDDCPLCQRANNDAVHDASRIAVACDPQCGSMQTAVRSHCDRTAPVPTPVPLPIPLRAHTHDGGSGDGRSEPDRDERETKRKVKTSENDELELWELEQEGFAQLGPLGGSYVAKLRQYSPIRRWEWDAARNNGTAKSWAYVCKVLSGIRAEGAAPPPPQAKDAPVSLDNVLVELERIASGGQREPHSDPIAQAVIVQRGGRKRLGAMDDHAFRLEKARFSDEYRRKLAAAGNRAEGVADGTVGASAAPF